MIKKEFIEGGLLILGSTFIAMGIICLAQLLVCWLDVKLISHLESIPIRNSSGFVRQIAPDLVRIIVGTGIILKNREIARRLDQIGVQ